MKTTKNSGKRKCSFGLSSLDFVGKKFSFEFTTASRKLKTKAGSGLTMVIGLVTTIATVLIGSKYFDTSSPSITFSNEIGPDIIQNLAQELLVPSIAVYLEGAPLRSNISRYVTIKLRAAEYYLDGSIGDWTGRLIGAFDYVDCKELNDTYFNQLLQKIDDRNRYKNILNCPDFKGNSSYSEVLTDI